MKEIICSTGEKVFSYEKYLNTRRWRKKKADYRKQFKYQCTMCDKTEGLHLHHMTYDRIGNEKFEDLVYLCAGCHSKIHTIPLDAGMDISSFKILKQKSNIKNKTDCSKCGFLKVNKSGKRICKFYKKENPKRKKCMNYYYDKEIYKRNKNQILNIKVKTLDTKLPKRKNALTFKILGEIINQKVDIGYLNSFKKEFPSGKDFNGVKMEVLTLGVDSSIKLKINNQEEVYKINF